MCRFNCATERGKRDVEQVHEEHVLEELVAVDAAVAQLSAEPAALLRNVHVVRLNAETEEEHVLEECVLEEGRRACS